VLTHTRTHTHTHTGVLIPSTAHGEKDTITQIRILCPRYSGPANTHKKYTSGSENNNKKHFDGWKGYSHLNQETKIITISELN